jgi:hypothetical protein
MDVSKIKGDPKEVLVKLTEPFFKSGTSPVFVASCCGRLFAGAMAPKQCRKCGGFPSAVMFASIDEVDPAKVPDQTNA